MIAGTASLLAEKVFYGTIDQNGFLQESFFLPLGFILILTGLACLTAFTARYIWRQLRKH